MWEHKEKVLKKQHILYALRLGVATIVKGLNLYGGAACCERLEVVWFGGVMLQSRKKVDLLL